MPIDFSQFMKPWTFRSESAGDWDVYPYSIKAMTAIEEFIQSEENESAQGVKILMRAICKRKADSANNGVNAEIREDEIGNFSKSDIQRFSQEFIEHNKNLIESAKEPSVKAEDQSDSDFLIEVLAAENKKQNAHLKDTFSSLRSRLGEILETDNIGLRSVTQSLLKQNENLENAYGSRLSSFSTRPLDFKPLPITENPIHKTNNHLTDMNARLDNLIGFGEEAIQRMHGLEVAAAEFLGRFSDEARKNSNAAKAAIFVGALAVLLSIGQIAYTEFRRVPQDSAAMSAALASVRGDINQLRTVISADLANSQASQEAASEIIGNALGVASDTNTALLQGIDQLLRQQRERDQAIIEALEVMAETTRNPSD